MDTLYKSLILLQDSNPFLRGDKLPVAAKKGLNTGSQIY